jgi:nitrite reductase/ring-hydroxylating ferredoxin subunit
MIRFWKSKPAADDDGFYDTGISAASVQKGQMTVVKVGGKTAVLTRVQGRLVAFSNVCPHAAADLSKGRLFDGQVKCPDHGYTFDLQSGRATWPQGEGCRLMRFTAKEENGMVKVRLSTSAPGG